MIKKIIITGCVLVACVGWATLYHIPITDGKITVTDHKILMAAAEGVTATGGTITSDETYWYHAFTNAMTTNFTVSGGSLSCDILIVAGGGGGGQNHLNSAGGAGGLIYTNITVSVGITNVVVGVGGVSIPRTVPHYGTNGGNSVFGSLVAYGGGGGIGNGTDHIGRNGGSGGGGSGDAGGPFAGGLGTNGQGNAGGTGIAYGSGGGGGAGSVGTNGTATVGGAGGSGKEYSQFSTIGGSPAGWFAGGGGGSVYPTGNSGGVGGAGGGGAGSYGDGEDGVPNTGGGGGGAERGVAFQSGYGGSGIVIVRYLK